MLQTKILATFDILHLKANQKLDLKFVHFILLHLILIYQNSMQF